MASESVTFREAAMLIRQGVNPEDVGDVPYIGLEHIEEGTLRLVGIGNAKSVTSTKFRFSKGDILFGKLRPYFRKVIRPNFDGVCSTDIWVVRSKEGIDQGYLYYWMASNDFVNFATQGSEGTKMPRAKWDHVDRFQRKRLTGSEQRAISHILGSLDNKIELNRRMNETLEATARAIFKSWFVDFDPVRAKADGGDPGLPDDIAELFPDSFEDSELGEIPTGWEIGKLQDILILQRGFDLPKKKRAPGRYPLIAASAQDGFHNEHKVSGPGVATGRSGKLGIVTFVHSHFWPLNTTLWVKAYKNSNCYHAYFLLQTLNLDAYNAGSAVPTLNRNHIHNLKLPVPNDSLLKSFELHSRELFFAIDKNTEQIAHLSQIRDTLLPKLISGELRVPHAEKFVEEAGV